MATDSTIREAASREFGTWLAAGGHQRNERSGARPPEDGGVWGGPTEAAWMKKLLRGALPPRESAGMAVGALVAHG